MKLETAFTMDTSSIKFGQGVTKEIGYDMKNFGCKRIMICTDIRLVDLEAVQITVESIKKAKIEFEIFSNTAIEPTDLSFKEAIEFSKKGKFDGYIGVGGGSSMDTVKVSNLYATYPAELLDYVNPPIGKGIPIPGALKPMICVPTTAGTGSETTGVAIFDLLDMKAKTGIAHRALRPLMGIIDSNNTKSLPPMITACTALDQISHSLESLTALPYYKRSASEDPKCVQHIRELIL